MANKRNVNALIKLIANAPGIVLGQVISEMLAVRLASRGVLVPSALTDEELERIGSDLDSRVFPDEVERAKAVACLERIAKGEDPRSGAPSERKVR